MINADMKSGIKWCVLGFILACVTWSTTLCIRGRPRDRTHSCPESLRDLAPDWIKNAKAETIGCFVVIASADSSNASAWIHTSFPCFPLVTFDDDDCDGRVDTFQIMDSSGRCFSIVDDDGDGKFDSWFYSTEMAEDSLFSDGDMDGQYDYRIDTEGKRSASIDSQWYDLVYRDDTPYVDIDGKLTEVKQVAGVWRFAE